MASTLVKLQTFRSFITSNLPPGQPMRRPANGGKLYRLQEPQFQVLVTDVYDELTRRTQTPLIPHLIAKNDLNDRRNQARAKLCTLSESKFFDLVCEVFTELENRRSQYESSATTPVTPSHPRPNFPQDSHHPPPPPPQIVNHGARGHDPHRPPANVSRPMATRTESSDTNRSNHSIASRSDAPGPYSQSPTHQQSTNYHDPRQRPAVSRNNGPPSGVNGNGSLSNLNPNFSSSMASLHSIGKPPSIDSSYMHSHPSPQVPPSRSSEDVDRIKDNYERQVQSLKLQVENLERSLSKSSQSESQKLDLLSENNQLKLDLQESRKTNAEQERYIANMTKETEQLRSELLEHQRSLRMGAEKDRDEKDNLRRQVSRITGELGELKSQNEHYNRRMKKLMDEKMNLENRLRDAEKLSKQVVPPTPPYPSDLARETSKGLGDTPYHDKTSEGGIDRQKMTQFQNSIDELLRTGRSDAPTSVLVCMKSVVMACRAISEDTEQYEAQAQLNSNDLERLRGYRSRLSTTLHGLTTAAKNHASGMGLSPLSLLESAAGHTTAAVIDIVRTIKLRPNSSSDSLTLSSPPTPKSGPIHKSHDDYHSKNGRGPSLDRSAGSGEITLTRSKNLRSDFNSVAGYNRPPSDTLYGATKANGYNRHSPPLVNGAKSESWDSQQTATPPPSDLTNPNSSLSVDDLRDFLEAKTDQAVQGIQDMLRTSRSEEVDPVALVLNLRQIVATVSSILITCRTSFEHYSSLTRSSSHVYGRPASYQLPPSFDPQRARSYLEGLGEGDHLLQTLVAEIYKAAQMAAINNQFDSTLSPASPHPASSVLLNGSSPRPGALHEFQIDNQDLDTEVVHDLVNDKIFKQRLTSAVFDVARSTKFLVSLME
ncbi:component of the polarisome [Dimargaris cristalligena]|nr:component of the polarisome [Dimargaris cristalligena]